MDRPSIPAEIEREVRQRCGFGCVICGFRLYDYDHIIGWAETRRHVAGEITLLCSEHHRMKTNKLISRDQIESFNAEPVNPRRGVTKPFGLMFGGQAPEMIIGRDTFRAPDGDLAPLVVDNVPIIYFQRVADDEILLNMILRDEMNLPRLTVSNNVLQMTPNMWDVQFVGQVLTVKNGPGDIFVRIRFDPPAQVVIESARILINGVVIQVLPSGININGNQYSLRGNRWEGGLGITIGFCPNFWNPIGFMRFQADRYRWTPNETTTSGDGEGPLRLGSCGEAAP